MHANAEFEGYVSDIDRFYMYQREKPSECVLSLLCECSKAHMPGVYRLSGSDARPKIQAQGKQACDRYAKT